MYSSSPCINDTEVCDGLAQCYDYSDEELEICEGDK